MMQVLFVDRRCAAAAQQRERCFVRELRDKFAAARQRVSGKAPANKAHADEAIGKRVAGSQGSVRERNA